MLEIYKGIKIEDEIIIVERKFNNNESQGYIVSINNKNQLDSALHWAEHYDWVYDETGERVIDHYSYGGKECTSDTPGAWPVYKQEKIFGVVHTYKNGQFKFSLLNSACSSSQGGKLSFWNCLITAPDNKEYIIGINSECLIQLLKNNTFINGICQANVWLGRIKNNVGAFTENMEEFEQGKKDKILRETKKTAKYDIGSVLIPSNKVYCGKFYKTFDIEDNSFYRWDLSHYNYHIAIFSKPEPVYLYQKYEYFPEKMYSWQFVKSKSTSAISEERMSVDIDVLNQKAKECKYNNEYVFNSTYDKAIFARNQGVNESEVLIPSDADIILREFVYSDTLEKNYKDYSLYISELKNFFDKYKIPYDIIEAE